MWQLWHASGQYSKIYRFIATLCDISEATRACMAILWNSSFLVKLMLHITFIVYCCNHGPLFKGKHRILTLCLYDTARRSVVRALANNLRMRVSSHNIIFLANYVNFKFCLLFTKYKHYMANNLRMRGSSHTGSGKLSSRWLVVDISRVPVQMSLTADFSIQTLAELVSG